MSAALVKFDAQFFDIRLYDVDLEDLSGVLEESPLSSDLISYEPLFVTRKIQPLRGQNFGN